MRQASRMQRKMDQVRAKLKDEEVSSTSAGGKVAVTVTCEGKLRHIAVDDAFLAEEGLDMTLDSVIAAANSALDKADKQVEAAMTKITGGVSIPGVTR